MACTMTTGIMTESYEEPVLGSASGTSVGARIALENNRLRRRRRHSSYHPAPALGFDADDVQILVDRFLAELGRRLDFIECYGHLKLDASIEFAYTTLHAVRESCARVSDGFLDAGRRRANVMVSTLEERYNDAIPTKESLEKKVLEGMRLMEGILAEFEARAYAVRDTSLGGLATDILDSGRRRMNEGFESSKRRMNEGLERAEGAVSEGIEKARRARDNIEHAVERALERARQHKYSLISYEELPYPWRVNQYISAGYRFHSRKIDCIYSVIQPSNELVNIWSHLIGLIIVLAIAFYFYPASPAFTLSTKPDVFIAAVFFFAAAKCLVCSTLWHTMSSISQQRLMERFACIDYTGISLLVAASIMTTEYTAFYCEPRARNFYLLTTASLGVAGIILPWHPTFNRADMAWARVLFYVGLATTGALPVFQLATTRGVSWAAYFYAPIAKSILIYLGGAIMYAAKVPERWFPGVFDYVGGSHNIWHVAVVGGILFHYGAMGEFFAVAFRRREEYCAF